jgi:hypothetical protein
MRRRIVFPVELLDESLGVVAVMSGGVPASSLLSGEWVETVVGDDVEAVLALHDVAHLASVDDFDTTPKIIATTRSRSGLRSVRQWLNRWFVASTTRTVNMRRDRDGPTSNTSPEAERAPECSRMGLSSGFGSTIAARCRSLHTYWMPDHHLTTATTRSRVMLRRDSTSC